MTISTQTRQLLALIAVCCAVAGIKLATVGISPSNDYYEYIETARAIGGEPGAVANQARILKPLLPLTTALIGQLTGYERAVVVQALLFYVALIVMMYLLAKEYLEDHGLAIMAATLVGLSYPVLKYGIEGYSETGAWFFFVTSLYLTVRLCKTPSTRLFFYNVIVVTIGFLWKEYAIVGGLILAAAFLAHPLISLKTKIWSSIGAVMIFVGVHAPWQLYVNYAYHFNYLKWSTTSAAGFSVEFTLKNIVKSLAAVLGLAWLAVPLGVVRLKQMQPFQRLFSLCATPVPFIAFLWGYISSRTFYVIAPPMVLLAVYGMRTWSTRARISMTAVTVAGNLAWLFLSYSIKL